MTHINKIRAVYFSPTGTTRKIITATAKGLSRALKTSFHELIVRDVLSKVNMEEALDKNVEFTGCFTVGRQGLLQITPVDLTVK